jgi:hypothetical protein
MNAKKTARACGKMAAGVPKNFSPEEKAKRAARFGHAAALARWKNHIPKTTTKCTP